MYNSAIFSYLLKCSNYQPLSIVITPTRNTVVISCHYPSPLHLTTLYFTHFFFLIVNLSLLEYILTENRDNLLYWCNPNAKNTAWHIACRQEMWREGERQGERKHRKVEIREGLSKDWVSQVWAVIWNPSASLIQDCVLGVWPTRRK